MRESVNGQLDLLLLATISDGPAHGYLIIERLQDRSDDVFDLQEGTVYPALHRLERAGLLESSWSEVAGRRRRVYRLTASGRTALARRRREWLRFVRGVSATLGPAR